MTWSCHLLSVFRRLQFEFLKDIPPLENWYDESLQLRDFLRKSKPVLDTVDPSGLGIVLT